MELPLVDPDLSNELTAPYWEGFQARELRLPRCVDCGGFHWHPRWRCPHCHSTEIRWTTVSGNGRVFTWVGVNYDFNLPFLAENVPLQTGLVTPFETESVRLAALFDFGDRTPTVGDPVSIQFVESDDSLTTPVFVPRE